MTSCSTHHTLRLWGITLNNQEKITESFSELTHWWSSSIQSLVLTSVCDMIMSSGFFPVVFEWCRVASAPAASGADGIFLVCLLMLFGICFLFRVLTHSFRSFSDWNISDLVFEHPTCFASHLLLRKNVKDPEKHETKQAQAKLSDVRIFFLFVPNFLDLKTTKKPTSPILYIPFSV